MQVQNILRHAMSEVISSEIVNNLVVTNSPEANVQLTRIHEHLFARTCQFLCSLNPMLTIVPCTRQPCRSMRLAPTNILSGSGNLRPRNDSRYSCRDSPRAHQSAWGISNQHSSDSGQRIHVLAHAAQCPIIIHRRILPQLRSRAWKHPLSASDRARTPLSQERARRAGSCRRDNLPWACEGHKGQRGSYRAESGDGTYGRAARAGDLRMCTRIIGEYANAGVV